MVSLWDIVIQWIILGIVMILHYIFFLKKCIKLDTGLLFEKFHVYFLFLYLEKKRFFITFTIIQKIASVYAKVTEVHSFILYFLERDNYNF